MTVWDWVIIVVLLLVVIALNRTANEDFDGRLNKLEARMDDAERDIKSRQ